VAVAALALPELRLEREWAYPPDTTTVIMDPAFERVALLRGSEPVENSSLNDQRPLARLPASTSLAAYVGLWSPDGRFFAVGRDRTSAGQTRDVEVWDVGSTNQMVFVRGSPWGAMGFHPRLAQITIAEPAALVTWDLKTRREIMRYPLAGDVMGFKFAPNGEQFAAALESGQQWSVAVCNAKDGKAGARHVFANFVSEFDWHPSGRGLAVTDYSGAVHWMNAQSGETRELGQHRAAAVRAVFSPDGNHLLTSGWDRQVICWDVKTMRRAFTMGLTSYQLKFRKDGSQCAFFSDRDLRLQLYTFERDALYREFEEDLGGGRNYAVFSPDGRWLAASGDGQAVVWDLAREGRGAAVSEPGVRWAGFTPNGELFANRFGGGIRWRVAPGTNADAPPQLTQLDLPGSSELVSLCLVSNGVVFSSPRGSKLLGLDQIATLAGSWKRTIDGINSASSDGRWLGIHRSYSPFLDIRRLPDMEPVARLTNQARINMFAFSPQGDEVAVGSRGGVEFWSTTTWQRTRCLTNYYGLLYPSDAGTIWLFTEFGASGLYDARTASPLLPLPPNMVPLALSSDGRRLAACVDHRHIQVWDLVEVRRRLRELGLE
jgi:WD40 repeat protein